MIHMFFPENSPVIAFAGILAAFLLTCLCTAKFAKYLPKDGGRDYAVQGKNSAGKPRGAGIIFVLVFAVTALIFADVSPELIIYIALVAVEMLTGYLDDASEKPWGELKKGLMDLAVAVVAAGTFLYFNTSAVSFAIFGITVDFPVPVYFVLAVLLVWMSINVTNCSDGVDGLSGTLSIISLITLYAVMEVTGSEDEFSFLILIFVVCILGYLWYNATPSRLMMGDAGSRAMGVFIALAAMKTGSPFIFLPAAIVLILDGGLGLVKVTIIRVLHVNIMKNVRLPLHDHVRKNLEWSNTQTVFRFAILQIIVSIATVYLIII
ncbi:MAG: phospho-N-acetylmuramoyl-pentapeptide-transferase [Lachnospiraceae bacterium]|nr:phospho-N-acetylmuramoyl-pentapeptide-transferase [Lachnospiraceae bacterium]